MTIRSVLLGLLLACFIASVTYFNDWVINQTMLIASHLPVAVFGVVVVGMLLLGPGLRLVGLKPMSKGELAVVMAMGLAACSWPGSNFWRYHTGLMVMPSHWLQTQSDWQNHKVMSYVPGGSFELAPGQVVDYTGLSNWLLDAEAKGEEAADTVAGRLWASLDSRTRRATRRLQKPMNPPDSASQDVLVRGINSVLRTPSGLIATPPTATPSEITQANRAALTEAAGNFVVGPPPGGGVLLGNGEYNEAVQKLVTPATKERLINIEGIEWSAWWPVMKMWGGVSLALAAAGLCLSLIVHPQWSRRELLTYPIARFATELTERKEGDRLPTIAHNRLFWIGLVGVAAIHLLNGLNTWHDTNVYINLTIPLDPLRELFPNASKVPLSWGAFRPIVFFTVIAFAFFLPRDVSFSLGAGHFLFVAVGAVMISQGLKWEYEKVAPSSTSFLRLGSYFGLALMILYAGRRYYLNVLTSAIGAKRLTETPAYATWACRGLIASVTVAIVLLALGGLSWDLALMLVGIILLSWLILNRVICETGAFFVTNAFIPAPMIAGFLGFEAMGPTGLLMVTLVTWVIISDPREALMPFISTGLQILDRSDVHPGKASRWIGGAVVLSLVVSTVVTLGFQYQKSVQDMRNPYAERHVPSMAFRAMSAGITEAQSIGTMESAVQSDWTNRWSKIDIHEGMVLYVGIGFVLVLACAFLRLRLPWWPLHPIMFAIWGTYASACFAGAFLMGWIVKSVVVSVGGANGYRSLRPLMIGLVAGELLAILGWTIAGACYYFIYGTQPPSISIFPG